MGADRRDRREGGAWTRAQAAKNALLYMAIRGAIAALSFWPIGWLRAMGRAVGAIAWAALPGARRTANANAARVLGDAAVARRSYLTLGGFLGETVALLARGARLPALPIDEASALTLALAQAEGRGVVFASAHLGPWERVAASLVAHGVPLTTIARESYDPRLTALYDRLRGGAGVRSIYRGHAGAAASIVRTLRRGGVLGVPMDLRSRVPSIDAPFLGAVAPTPVGPARIALRTGAAVVVGTAVRDETGALGVRVTRIPTADLGPDDAGERALTARINDELSRRILAMPDAWVWMHDRFPEGAAALH